MTRPPVVLLAHASRPVTADGNAPFARPLVREGFAVFRYDKRGVGRSGGEYSRAFEHMTVAAGDVVAAADHISSDARIDATARLAKPFTVRVYPGFGHSLETDDWPGVFDWYRSEFGS